MATYNPDCEDDWWAAGEEKAEEESDGREATEGSSRTASEELKKKKKKRKRRKITEQLNEETVEVFSVLHTAARQHKELVHTLLPHLSANMSPVEAASVLLKVKHFIGYKAAANEESTCMDAGPFLSKVCPMFREWEESIGGDCHGAPVMIILTSSAIRAVELRRSVSLLPSKGVIAKLFAKHMKIEQQAIFLSTHLTTVAIATPNRARKLINRGSLSLEHLKCVVIDWYWRDQKSRRIGNIPEVWREFCGLFVDHINQLLRSKQCRLILY